MSEPTYLYSYGSGAHGASTTRRTRQWIEAQPQFDKVHPVLMDRLFALADAVIAAGSDYGFGGGWRSSLQQRNLFLSRYTKYPNPPGVYWDGSPSWPQDKGWYRHTSGAPSAPPGRSYHESTTDDGLGDALAVDMVGDHAKANPLAAKFGLRHFGNINGEPWHYQPVEIPNARRNYAGEFENVTLPPEPDPEEEEESMHNSRLWRPKGYQNIFIITPSGNVLHASQALLAAFQIPVTNIIEDDHPQTLLSMLRLAGCTASDLVKAA